MNKFSQVRNHACGPYFWWEIRDELAWEERMWVRCVEDEKLQLPRLELSGYSSLLAFSKTTSIKRLSIPTPLKNNAKQITLDKPDISFLNFTSSNSTQPHIHETNKISPPSTSSQVTQPHKASRCLREVLPSERKEGCS
jgi:hypothetical protein